MGDGLTTTPVSRITLFCRNLDQSLELYRDILGFKEIENKTIQSKEFNELMNIEDENCFVRISYLQSKESEHGLIACLLYTSPSPRDLSTTRMPSSA